METQKCENFSKSSKLTKLNSVRTPSFRTPRKKKRPGFVNISPYISNWYINGKVFTSTTAWEPKNLFFSFFKKFEIEFDLHFDLCWRAEIIQVGLNMHLYVDIGDASSSLWGSTSSFQFDFDVKKINRETVQWRFWTNEAVWCNMKALLFSSMGQLKSWLSDKGCWTRWCELL